MQKKTINKHTEFLTRNLSIQFSLDGFSFCVSNEKGEESHLSSYTFDKTLTSPKELLVQIEEIFKSETQLHHDFKEVHVIHQNPYNSFVPSEYFSEEDLKNYLNFSIKTLSTDYISYDDLANFEMKNVYIPYVNINNFLFQNFGEFEYHHHASILVEKLKKFSNVNEQDLFCLVSKSSLDIVCFKKGEFVFYNSFNYETKEDFIYYILFVVEQLKLDTNQVKLSLLGDINSNSDLYTITYKYIRNVSFLAVKNSFLDGNKEVENYANFLITS